MGSIKDYYNQVRVKIRERFNPLLAPLRKLRLNDKSFTIISNNCWGGHVYRYFGIPYLSPTIGLYIFSDDYIKFLNNLHNYMQMDLTFIPIDKSKYQDILRQRGGKNASCPIGLLGDIEIVFLHYDNPKEAKEKWNRRKARINWDNIVVKFSEQNLCTLEILKKFDELKYDKKIMFVTREYGFQSEVVSKEYYGQHEIANDTIHFRRYINLSRLINGR